MTEYIYAANVICPVESIALGNALAAAIDPDTGGALTFTNGAPLFPAGTTFVGDGMVYTASNPVSAMAAFPLLKATGYGMFQEFLSAGPWPNLNAIGVDNDTIATMREVMKIEVGTREAIYGRGLTFCVEQGYVVP